MLRLDESISVSKLLLLSEGKITLLIKATDQNESCVCVKVSIGKVCDCFDL